MFHNLNDKLNTITDYLSFGIKALDLHNEKFYKLLEELRIYSTTKEKKSVFKEILDEFEAYSNYHFTIEENMMLKCNFPERDSHISQHKFFIRKIQEFKQSFKYGNTMIDEQMLNFMRKWFVVHISDSDKQFATYYHLNKQSNKLKNINSSGAKHLINRTKQ
jgi:hemerythrin